jgi:hypothetical protein
MLLSIALSVRSLLNADKGGVAQIKTGGEPRTTQLQEFHLM